MASTAASGEKHSSFRKELRASAALGSPLALGELGWMSTYIIDALMIGRLPHSALPIAASSLGNTLYYAIAFFAVYMLNGLETYVSQARGRGDDHECVRLLGQSMWIVLAGTPFVIGATLAAATLLPHFGTPPDLFAETQRYLRPLVWSTAPLMLYMAIRRFLQSVNRVLLVSVSLISAGPMDWLFDWLFLYGHQWRGHSIPALAIAGSGWATVSVRCWMLLVLLPGVWLALRERGMLGQWKQLLGTLRPDTARLKALLAIGWPSGLQFSLELGISTYMSVLCARLGTVALAAHQVTLDLNAFVYMVPTGLSYAAMIRVGQAAGRNQMSSVRGAAQAALTLAFGYCALAICTLLLASHRLAGLYTNDSQVVAQAVPLLVLCSVLILADATFVIYESALTGLGDTRTPMYVSIVCNWVFGMPLAYLLAFRFGHGVYGLWQGRALASATSAVALTLWWRHRTRAGGKELAAVTLPFLSPVRAR